MWRLLDFRGNLTVAPKGVTEKFLASDKAKKAGLTPETKYFYYNDTYAVFGETVEEQFHRADAAGYNWLAEILYIEVARNADMERAKVELIKTINELGDFLNR